MIFVEKKEKRQGVSNSYLMVKDLSVPGQANFVPAHTLLVEVKFSP
jgi:hypothetical protein